MRPTPKTLLRGFAKLLAVVAVAGLAGAGLGIALADLSANNSDSTPVATSAAVGTATTSAATTATSAGVAGGTRTATTGRASSGTPTTSTTRTTTTRQPNATATRGASTSTGSVSVEVKILSARLGAPSSQTGRAQVMAMVRLTNHGKVPIKIAMPRLISGSYDGLVDHAARDAAGALLKTLPVGKAATGTLRFTTTPAVTQRLLKTPTAHLRIANRKVALKLTPPTAKSSH